MILYSLPSGFGSSKLIVETVGDDADVPDRVTAAVEVTSHAVLIG
jgi:hypothetical protein